MKNELETILKAFEEHIEGQDYFDIVYSKKAGYLWIVIDRPGDAGAKLLDTPEEMLDVLFNDIINDVSGVRIPKALTARKLPDAIVYKLEKLLKQFVRDNGL